MTEPSVRIDVTKVPGLPEIGITQVVRVGNLVFVSGQLALDERGKLVGDGDCRAQADCCLLNIEAALAAVGGSREEIVKLVCYLKSASDLSGYSGAKAAFFTGSSPASTAVIVHDLLVAGALLEVDAVAHVRTVTTTESMTTPVEPAVEPTPVRTRPPR